MPDVMPSPSNAAAESQPATSDLPGRPHGERRVVAWVGASVIFKGDLTSSEDITIDGRVEGRIELPEHTLTIGPTSQIAADILAKRVDVLGAVTGTIMATDFVDVHDSATVEGDIIAGRLAVAEGAKIRGHVETRQSADQAGRPFPRGSHEHQRSQSQDRSPSREQMKDGNENRGTNH